MKNIGSCKTHKRTLGTVPISNTLREGDYIIFAGRRARIMELTNAESRRFELLLRREGDGLDGNYFNTPGGAAFLDRNSPDYVGGILEKAHVVATLLSR